MRYVVTEIEGYGKLGGGSLTPGLSAHVIDTAWNYRTVATFRTENDLAWGAPLSRGEVRERAATRCDLLNRLDEIAREAQGAVA